MKFCAKCAKPINETDEEEKYVMIITKRGNKILEFECFHFDCWKEFFDESVEMMVRER